MQGEQLAALLAMNAISKLRLEDARAILDYFGQDAAAAWQEAGRWPELALWPDDLAREISASQSRLEPERLYAEFLAAGCGVSCLGDEDYPPLLARIYDPPLLLFYRGRLPKADQLCLAMIGSRRASPYGFQVAEIFGRDLAHQGAVVVSGMARGIDSTCHQAALAAGGETVAVLGCGVDVIYPRENERLYARICQQGAVISEFPLGTAALPHNFPRRNRIISGLSQGVVVIEAGEKSGTLLTVNFALEQGRDVFAVPGSVISPASRGTNRLLRDGAKPALSAEDIWQHYRSEPMRKPARKPRTDPPGPQLSPQERRLLALLAEPARIDQLADRPELELDAAALAAMLTILEIRGLVRQLPGQYYQTVVKHIRA